MFAAHARLRLPPVELDFDIGLETEFRIGSTRRFGAIWDTRFTAPNPGPGERALVYFVLEGELAWHDPDGFVVRPDGAFVSASGHFEGANGRRLRTVRSNGAPFLGIELHVAPGDVAGAIDRPRPLTPSAKTLACARAYATLVHQPRRLDATERDAPLADLLRALHEDGVLTRDLGPTIRPSEGAEALLWRAFVPFVEELVVGPSLEIMSSRTKMSLRQLGRAVDRFLGRFGLPWDGWRALTRGYRLHVAVLLLSNPELSAAAIADRCGYSSAEALAHALTAEGLPSPIELRRQILAAR